MATSTPVILSNTPASMIVSLIAALLPLALQFGPELVSEVSALIKGSNGLNAAALKAAIDSSLSNAATTDAAVLAG